MMATVSTHVLNGVDGSHAGGIRAQLVNLGTGRVVFSVKLDARGRLSQSVDLTGASPDDRYELCLATGDYWKERGLTAKLIVDEIVLRFSMPDQSARYHLPVIFAPNSYSCWTSAPE